MVTGCSTVRGYSTVRGCSRRADLLAADEDVVRVGVARVDGVGHRVKGADIGRELVDHVKVLPVLLGHHLIRVRVRVRVSSSATTR